MIRLIRLEFLKLKANRALWILLGLYMLCLVLIAFSGGTILKYIESIGFKYKSFSPTMLPIYDFEDIWQNLAWLGYFFKIFPAFLLIISITNEFQFKTHRQNIIDGLSRNEFFLSKLSFAAFLACLSGVLLFVLGIILGISNANLRSIDAFMGHLYFIPAHIFQLFLYFIFAIFLALLIRKSAITIVLVLLYTIFLEPIASTIIGHWYPIFASWLPLESFANVVRFPFSRYLFFKAPDFISISDLLIASTWGGIFLFGIFYQLKKRDF